MNMMIRKYKFYVTLKVIFKLNECIRYINRQTPNLLKKQYYEVMQKQLKLGIGQINVRGSHVGRFPL